MATILLAWQAEKMVPGKKASVALYKTYIHDEWTTFIEEMYLWGNSKWHYLIPQTSEEQQHLRNLCMQALKFENYYMHQYELYLHKELCQEGARKAIATQRLKNIIVTDS
jgi:dTDP-4-amino-4,6-dideoxygalactose transaminase